VAGARGGATVSSQRNRSDPPQPRGTTAYRSTAGCSTADAAGGETEAQKRPKKPRRNQGAGREGGSPAPEREQGRKNKLVAKP